LQLYKKIKKEKYETQVDDRFKVALSDDRFSLGPGKTLFFLLCYI
jgi:hypothetical protein